MAERPNTRQGSRPVTQQSAFDRPSTRHAPERPVTQQGYVDRPSTRHSGMMNDRPGTRQGSARPFTSGRPLTGLSRPSSALRTPGTASRLATAMRNQSPSRPMTGSSIVAQVNVVDRPITQQGLSGLKTGARGPQRQIQDKSYFLGLLRTKVGELNSEISKLNKEKDTLMQEQSAYTAYDKRVKEVASELTGLQGELADYNLLVDKGNIGATTGELEAECVALKATNDKEAAALDNIFAQKKEQEQQILQLQREIEQERNVADSMVSMMSPELRSQYMSLKDSNKGLLHEMESLQQNLDALTARKQQLEDELAPYEVKQEAVMLYEKLADAERRHEELIEEERKKETPEQERERLLRQVKEDNAEVAAMERNMQELQEKMKQLQEDLSQIDQDLEENQSERNQKYRELRKREETMDQFLAGFEDSRKEEEERLSNLEEQTMESLEKISRHISHFGHVPSLDEYSNMRQALATKEGELDKSKNTMQGLSQERQHLQMNLEKIEALEEKVKTEMSTLREKSERMEREMVQYSNLDGLRMDSEENRRRLMVQREKLEQQKMVVSQQLGELELSYTSIKNQLNDNETWTQLCNLEKKWSHLEQSNWTMKEFIAAKQSEGAYEPLKNKVLTVIGEYNKFLQEAQS